MSLEAQCSPLLTLITLLESVILICSYCQEYKNYFYLEGTEYCLHLFHLPHLDVCCIIWGNSTLEDNCDLYTPSSELFKELDWQTFPERVTYQQAILMYRIINNICPD